MNRLIKGVTTSVVRGHHSRKVASKYIYRQGRLEDVEEMKRFIGTNFFQREVLTHAFGCNLQNCGEWTTFKVLVRRRFVCAFRSFSAAVHKKQSFQTAIIFPKLNFKPCSLRET